MATKAQLVTQAIDLGIPAQRLTGTKSAIQEQIDTYSAAMAEASADTAQALQATQPIEAAATNKGIHPMNALAFGATLGAALHFIG